MYNYISFTIYFFVVENIYFQGFMNFVENEMKMKNL